MSLPFRQRAAEHEPPRALFVGHGEFHREHVHASLADDFKAIGVGRACLRPDNDEKHGDKQDNRKRAPKLRRPPYATRQ